MHHCLFDRHELMRIGEKDCLRLRVVDIGGVTERSVPGESMSNYKNLEATIKVIMARIFEVRPEEITDKTRRRELERWDSLSHLTLLVALQEEFHIEIPQDQALEMETLEDIKRAVTCSRGTTSPIPGH
jgi:acyl carrier protein